MAITEIAIATAAFRLGNKIDDKVKENKNSYTDFEGERYTPEEYSVLQNDTSCPLLIHSIDDIKS